MKKEHQDIFSDIKNSVLAGGAAIMEVYNGEDFKVFTKQGVEVGDEVARKEVSSNYKTEADEASHRVIAEIMGEKNYHGIPLIFEEADWNDIVSGTYISFDEMDGTGRFIKRKQGFMVLGLYVEKGIPVLSANYDPIGDKLYWAVKDEESFIDDKLAQIDKTSDFQNARVVINGRDKERPENKDYWDFMYSHFGERLSAGLATGSRIAGILDGKYDAFVNNGSEKLHIWDMGMILNLTEVGGIATRKDGSKLDFQNPGVIEDIVCSTNPRLHEKMIDTIKQYNLRG